MQFLVSSAMIDEWAMSAIIVSLFVGRGHDLNCTVLGFLCLEKFGRWSFSLLCRFSKGCLSNLVGLRWDVENEWNRASVM